MRPYRIDEKRRHGIFEVPLRGFPAAQRPNRLAAGMSYTQNRSGLTGRKVKNRDVLFLLVGGTTDSLRGGLMLSVAPKVCPCCGHKTGKLALNKSGKVRLAAARRRAASRQLTKMADELYRLEMALAHYSATGFPVGFDYDRAFARMKAAEVALDRARSAAA